MSDQKPQQSVESRIDRIEVTLGHAVDAIEKLAAAVNAPQETKWGPILAALGLLFAAAGGYTTLITMPMEREAEQLRVKISKLEERELQRERFLGRLEGRHGVTVDE
jgi:uncharacterized coiled-coil protein SlyX